MYSKCQADIPDKLIIKIMWKYEGPKIAKIIFLKSEDFSKYYDLETVII